MLRACERWLLARVDLLLVSSPAFLTHYFEARQCYSGPSLLVENKVVEFERTKLPAHRPTAPPGPPWRIGWFGILRCRASPSAALRGSREAKSRSSCAGNRL